MKGLTSLSLTVVVCLFIGAVSAFGQSSYRFSGPYTHQNLTIFLIHGEDTNNNKSLITLQEAMEMKIFKVYETEDVNELIVENISPKYDVFIQSGDIVKGGKQDRVLAISIIVPRNSGKVSIEAFCVESDRWDGRGDENEKEFSSSEERIVSRELKIAANGVVSGSGSGSGSGNGVGAGSASGSGSGSGNVEQNVTVFGSRSSSGPGTGSGGGSQTAVWNEVANAQRNISANVTADVTVNSSATSLQLSLENKKLVRTREEFAKNFSDLLKGKTDVIGYAFAINGEINSADIYVSNHLFAKLWPKMLNATVTEAISLADQEKAESEPNAGDINSFLARAYKGKAEERQTVAKSKVVTRQTENEVVYEAKDKAGVVVHRSYVKLK
ncbi:MAG TPA: hypothetical protein PKE66_10335 [Pyrinomonadaceae bacterium]|nr:hypothetical protein [Pyrinomonadaceae bacterium]